MPEKKSESPKEVDLFGKEYDPKDDVKAKPGVYQARKIAMHYRVSEFTHKKCGNCKNHTTHRMSRLYHKCIILGCSSSEHTDIRVRNLCDHWEAAPRKKKW